MPTPGVIAVPSLQWTPPEARAPSVELKPKNLPLFLAARVNPRG
jgi:hypothetical protein